MVTLLKTFVKDGEKWYKCEKHLLYIWPFNLKSKLEHDSVIHLKLRSKKKQIININLNKRHSRKINYN